MLNTKRVEGRIQPVQTPRPAVVEPQPELKTHQGLGLAKLQLQYKLRLNPKLRF